MKTQSIIKRTVVMELTEEEAEWLHAVMQNPINLEPRKEEAALDYRMRHAFFDATTFRD